MGAYANYWGAMGESLESFIISINSDYFAKKLGKNLFSFCPKSTVKNLRKAIKEEYEGELQELGKKLKLDFIAEDAKELIKESLDGTVLPVRAVKNDQGQIDMIRSGHDKAQIGGRIKPGHIIFGFIKGFKHLIATHDADVSLGRYTS